MTQRTYLKSTKDRLIVDIGRYSVVYAVLDPMNKVKFFKVESFVGDLSDLFEESTIKFIERVVTTSKELKLNFSDIEDIVLVIPTKDILLSSSNKITAKSLSKILYEQYRITDDVGLVQSISRPYRIGSKYFTPVSFYDKNIDKFILELDKTGNEAKDRVRANVIFQTSLYRLIEMANNTTGRVAIIDSSFSVTRVLLAKDGNPIEYNEFELCGQTMLKHVYSKSDRDIESIIKIINSYQDAADNSIKEAIIARNYLHMEAKKEIIPHLRNARVDKIIFTGGLCHTDYLDGLNVPIERLERYYTTEEGLMEIPEPIEYKLFMALETPTHGGLLDESNIDIITGERDIDDYSILDDFNEYDEDVILKTEEIIGDQNQLNNDYFVDMSKSIKETYNIRESADKKVRHSALKKSAEESGMTIINLEEDKPKEQEKIKIKSVTPEQLGMLEDLKRRFKKPSKYERKTPVLVSGIMFAILLVTLLVGLNYAKLINMPIFEAAGVEQPYQTPIELEYARTLVGKTRKVCKKVGIMPNKITVQPAGKNIKLNGNGVLAYRISTPITLDFKYNIGFYLVSELENIMNDDINMLIQVNPIDDKINNNYIVTIESEDFRVAKGKKPHELGQFKVMGEDKWTLEEDRLFFDANDLQDFLDGNREVGDPSRREIQAEQNEQGIQSDVEQPQTSPTNNQQEKRDVEIHPIERQTEPFDPNSEPVEVPVGEEVPRP